MLVLHQPNFLWYTHTGSFEVFTATSSRSSSASGASRSPRPSITFMT